MRSHPHEARIFRDFGDVTYFLRQKSGSLGVPKHATSFSRRCTQLSEYLAFGVFVVCDLLCYLVYDAYARVQDFVLLTTMGIHTTQYVFHSSLSWEIIRMG